MTIEPLPLSWETTNEAADTSVPAASFYFALPDAKQHGQTPRKISPSGGAAAAVPYPLGRETPFFRSSAFPAYSPSYTVMHLPDIPLYLQESVRSNTRPRLVYNKNTTIIQSYLCTLSRILYWATSKLTIFISKNS